MNDRHYVEDHIAAKAQARADKMVFIGFVVLVVAATVTYIIK